MTGESIEKIMNGLLKTNPWDFLLRARAKGKDRFEYGGFPIQKTCRYYVSKTGAELMKIMPPLPNSSKQRRMAVQKNEKVRLAIKFDGNLHDVNLDWYVNEVKKLF
jgi:hypothetical protein